MAFELFDLKHTIRIHNQMHRSSRVGVESTFGLEVFSDEFSASLTAGFDLYHNGYYLHKGFEGKRVHEYQVQRANSQSIPALRKLVAIRKKDGEAAQNFVLREKMAKENPSLNEGFAHYTHNALWEAYGVLRILENKLRYAEAHVKQARFRFFNRVPQYVIKKHANYVKKQLKVINSERRKLRLAMMTRLCLASRDPSLRHGDPLYALDPNSLIENELDESNLRSFYNIIKADCDVDMKNHLYQMSWIPMADKISEHPVLRQFHDIYNFAKVETTSQWLHQQSEENKQNKKSKGELESMLAFIDEAEDLIKKEFIQCAKAQEATDTWWYRLFDKQSIELNGRVQQWLLFEAENIQKHRALIQHKLDLIAVYSERELKESALLAPLKQDDHTPTEEELNKLTHYCKTMNQNNPSDNKFLKEVDRRIDAVFEKLKTTSSALLMSCTRLIEALRGYSKKDEATIIENEFKELEDLLLSSLISKFNFSRESLEYLMKFKNQMIEQNIAHANNLPALTSGDKAFLGLATRNLTNLFLKDSRQAVSLTLNLLVALHRHRNEVLKMNDHDKKVERVQITASEIHKYLEKNGAPEIQLIIRERINNVRSN